MHHTGKKKKRVKQRFKKKEQKEGYETFASRKRGFGSSESVRTNS